MQTLNFLVYGFVGAALLIAVIKSIASEIRKNRQTDAAAKAHVLEAESLAQKEIIAGKIAQHQLAALEANFQVYFENNLVNTDMDAIIEARAKFEALYTTPHTEHLIEQIRPHIMSALEKPAC